MPLQNSQGDWRLGGEGGCLGNWSYRFPPCSCNAERDSPRGKRSVPMCLSGRELFSSCYFSSKPRNFISLYFCKLKRGLPFLPSCSFHHWPIHEQSEELAGTKDLVSDLNHTLGREPRRSAKSSDTREAVCKSPKPQVLLFANLLHLAPLTPLLGMTFAPAW